MTPLAHPSCPWPSAHRSRRAFLATCAALAVTLGLPGGARALAGALRAAPRLPVVWLEFQSCTGCSMALLQAENDAGAAAGGLPSVDFAGLLFDRIALEFHATFMAAAGADAEAALAAACRRHAGRYLLVVEGAVPRAAGACATAGVAAVDRLRAVAADAAAVVAIGSCAAWGGMPASAPNPTRASGVAGVLGRSVLTLPGCPPNPRNFVAVIAHYLAFGGLPPVDAAGRPAFAYGATIHERCPRREHFAAGRFAERIGDAGHRRGWCLHRLGCKGPLARGNCPDVRFGGAGADTWPVACGLPCLGCTEAGVAFEMPLAAVVPVRDRRRAGPASR